MAADDSSVQLDFWGEQDQPRRLCRVCKQMLPLKKFHIVKEHGKPRWRKHTCKFCRGIRSARWKKENPEKLEIHKQAQTLRVHGLTRTRYQAMLDAQGGVCAICGKPETGKHRNGKIRRLAVDHDHTTGQIRQLLCGLCNVVLGLCEDDPEICERAAAYLRKHREKG